MSVSRNVIAEQHPRGLRRNVAKWKYGRYVSGPETSWVKIKNPAYTQIQGRHEQFNRMRQRANQRENKTPVLFRCAFILPPSRAQFSDGLDQKY